MKILINTASTLKGGGVQVARSFIDESRNFKGHDYHVILGKMLSELVKPSDYPGNFSFYKIGYRPATRVLSFKRQDKFFKNLEKSIKPDVVFTTSGPAYWRPNAPHLVGYNLPHYIYKDSPFFSQISLLKQLKWYLKGHVLKYFFKRDADSYVVQTDDVNRRLRRWLDTNQVYTVSNTVSRHYLKPKNVASKLPEKKKNEFRFLSFSSWYAHKNLDIIPNVIDALSDKMKESVKFVLTLPQDIYRDKFSQDVANAIINIGPVKPDEGPALYRECDAMFLPTLLECFSASYVEAMRMEKPIITSNLGFAHTVCGDAALYADPMNPKDIASKITQLIEQPILRERLMKEGIEQQKMFVTASERAKEYLNICKELVDAQN